jgi:hypothetical protein
MHYLYGKDIQVQDLTADQKSTISAIVGLGGAAIGATGGAADVTQGSMAAVNAVENNRQLVETEKQALARLKQGKTKAEQDRLDAAACFLIKCSAEFPADSQEYAYYKALENKGAGLKTEQAALLAYKNESLEYKPVGYSNFSVEKVSVKDLFRYSQADANSDSQILAYSNNSNRIRNSLKDSLNLSDETIDRALNIGQGLLLIGSVIGGKGKGGASAAANVTCKTSNCPVDMNHSIGGDISSKGKVTGGHSTLRGDVKVVEITAKPDGHGVYEAKVDIRKPDGTWETKTDRYGNPMHNTMFPVSWSEDRVKAEVSSAWNAKDYKVEGVRWSGTSNSGVKIGGFITPNKTAYPIYNGGKK